MATHYHSFVFRWWHSDTDTNRIKVEHVQSGASIQVTTVEQALPWMRAMGMAQPAAVDSPAPARPSAEPPDVSSMESHT